MHTQECSHIVNLLCELNACRRCSRWLQILAGYIMNIDLRTAIDVDFVADQLTIELEACTAIDLDLRMGNQESTCQVHIRAAVDSKGICIFPWLVN